MHYSIVPWEDIFLDYEKFEPQYKIISKGKLMVQVLAKENNKYELVRIFSSNPEDYLDPGLQPGLELKINDI